MISIIDHPLVQHKLSLMRNKNTDTKDFRELTLEISQMIGYEAMRKLRTSTTEVETPLTKAIVPTIANTKIALVPILRAGLIMAEGISKIVPSSIIGHIGIRRDPDTHLPIKYLNKLPNNIKDSKVFLLDPMLATGGSAIVAVNILKNEGVTDITFISILSSPEGISNFKKNHPEIDIFVAAVDEKLTKDLYIYPGLGDAGDRIFGTL